MRTLLVAAACVAALAVAAPAMSSERHPTLQELETMLICPTCHTTLDQSDAPIARRMKRFIVARIAAGDSASQIKAKLVAQFGEAVLAAPPKNGFDLLAWWLPLAGIAAGAGVLGIAAWRWSSRRGGTSPPALAGGPPLAPELERRLDEELRRYDR